MFLFLFFSLPKLQKGIEMQIVISMKVKYRREIQINIGIGSY
jgi:hypothetical protein